MAQMVFGLRNGEAVSFPIPDPDDILFDAITWGRHEAFFTPAYWASQTVMADFRRADHRLGQTLHEEVAACLLGGHGIPAEIGLAAFTHLRSIGLLEEGRSPSEHELHEALTQPLRRGNRMVRYRFAAQKASYLAPVLKALSSGKPPADDDLAFRDWFLSFKGIGPKTASWIARNWLGSDNVAILDIHLHRAGLIAGIFSPNQTIQRHYFEMEWQFVRFARALNVSPSHLDAVIWFQMKEAGSSVFPLLSRLLKNDGFLGRAGKLEELAIGSLRRGG